MTNFWRGCDEGTVV